MNKNASILFFLCLIGISDFSVAQNLLERLQEETNKIYPLVLPKVRTDAKEEFIKFFSKIDSFRSENQAFYQAIDTLSDDYIIIYESWSDFHACQSTHDAVVGFDRIKKTGLGKLEYSDCLHCDKKLIDCRSYKRVRWDFSWLTGIETFEKRFFKKQIRRPKHVKLDEVDECYYLIQTTVDKKRNKLHVSFRYPTEKGRFKSQWNH